MPLGSQPPQQGDYIQLATNDGRVLTLPDQDYGMSVWGNGGAPPTQFITRQGYKQHGETEVGYILQKRPITLSLYRSKACSRAQYWQNRAALHDFLRPDRNGPITLTVVQGGADNTGTPNPFQKTNCSAPGYNGSTWILTGINGTDYWGRSPAVFVGQILAVEAEQALVLGINLVTGAVLVRRGYNGTSQVVHSGGVQVYGSLYPAVATGVKARSIVVRADPGAIFAEDPQRESGWFIQEKINFIAFDPIWFDPSTNILAPSSTQSQFLIFPITFPIQFGVNGLQFVAQVTYAGSWYGYPIITLTGPYQSAVITNTATGVSFTMNVPLIGGAQRIINTTPGILSVVDATGVSYFSELGPASNLVDFNLRPDPEAVGGVQTITVNMLGTSAGQGSAASVSYQNRYFGL